MYQNVGIHFFQVPKIGLYLCISHLLFLTLPFVPWLYARHFSMQLNSLIIQPTLYIITQQSSHAHAPSPKQSAASIFKPTSNTDFSSFRVFPRPHHLWSSEQVFRKHASRPKPIWNHSVSFLLWLWARLQSTVFIIYTFHFITIDPAPSTTFTCNCFKLPPCSTLFTSFCSSFHTPLTFLSVPALFLPFLDSFTF